MVHRLEKENIELREQINDMEEFLSDYGLHWIGEKPLGLANTVRSGRAEWIPKKAEPPAPPPQTLSTVGERGAAEVNDNGFRVDYDLLVSNIKELNELVEAEEPTIVTQANGATFATSQTSSVPLTLFANGLALYEGPFRAFAQDPLARKFCLDICDGYFPSELQSAFPDGVALRLIDKRHIHFQPTTPNSVFHSKGYRLGSATATTTAIAEPEAADESNTQPATATKNVQTQLSDSPPMTIDQFLAKLPSSVIKNGNLIPVRQDLSNLLTQPTQRPQPQGKKQEQGHNAQPTQNAIIDSPALQSLRTRCVQN
jgi:hypothetical protein